MKTKRKSTVWNKEDCMLLEELYVTQKLPAAEIAAIFNTNKDAIWRKTESLGLARKVKYEVDHFYFSKMDTISKWYVLGILSADGFLDSKNNRVGINLQIRDIAVIEFIKKELKFQGNILIKKAGIVKGTGNLSQEQAYIKFTSSQITQDLIALGVTDRKSLTLEFPNIPDKFIGSYLLGYFDGDGCVSHRTFTLLGTEDVCENFERKIRQLAKVDKRKIYKRNKQKNTIYVLTYSKKDTILKLYDFLYKEAGFYMERKYLKFTELVEDIHCRNSTIVRYDHKEIYKLFSEQNLSRKEIMAKQGISKAQLSVILRKQGLQKSISEQSSKTIEDFYAYNKQCIYE